MCRVLELTVALEAAVLATVGTLAGRGVRAVLDLDHVAAAETRGVLN